MTLFTQALIIMTLGMGLVFLFLFILIMSVQGVARLVRIIGWDADLQEKPEKAAPVQDSSALVAAIAAAMED
jgi:sodium pump decarboxylase gamma subunit